MTSLDANAALLLVAAVCLVSALVWYARQELQPSERGDPLLDRERVFSLLCLGPAGSGKSTLFCHALTLCGETSPSHGGIPTRGIVRRLLKLPTRDDHQLCVLCDAGGGRAEQRQWVTLIRQPETVGAVVFVADLSDESETTLSLFKQVAQAKWSRHATLILALTHADQINDNLQLHAIQAAREHAYKEVCSREMSVHSLDTRDEGQASALLMEAAASISASSKGATHSTQRSQSLM